MYHYIYIFPSDVVYCGIESAVSQDSGGLKGDVMGKGLLKIFSYQHSVVKYQTLSRET